MVTTRERPVLVTQKNIKHIDTKRHQSKKNKTDKNKKKKTQNNTKNKNLQSNPKQQNGNKKSLSIITLKINGIL